MPAKVCMTVVIADAPRGGKRWQKGSKTVRPAGEPEGLLRATLRRWLLIAAGAVTIFGIFHHFDHVVRGNHSGWPFQEAVTPFTFSLLIYALLVPGLYLTWRGHLVAGYWLFTAAVLFAVVTLAHFVGAQREAPIRDIYAVYDNPVWGFLALAVCGRYTSAWRPWRLRPSRRSASHGVVR